MHGFGEIGGRSVCLNCIIDERLREQVAPHLTEDACTFCGREAEDNVPIATRFEELMRPVMDAIHFFYESSEDSLFGGVMPHYSSQYVVDNICVGAVSDDVLQAIFAVRVPLHTRAIFA